VLGVQQGFPRDTNNFAPRVGLAWDFDERRQDGLPRRLRSLLRSPALSHRLQLGHRRRRAAAAVHHRLPGSPAPTATLNLLQIFQGTVVPGVTPGVAASSQYLRGQLRFNDQTFPGFGPILPFTLAVEQNFKYAYANQANVTLERQLTKDTSVSASYIFVGAHHLPHPRDVNAPQTELLVENFRRFAVGNPVICPSRSARRAPRVSPTVARHELRRGVLFPIPTASNALFTVRIPGLVAVNNVSGQTIVSPLAANFFRPNAPNYFFVQSVTGGAVTPAVFNAAIAGSVRTPGLISPFGDVSAQVSDGNSNYNAMTLEAKRRFSNNFQFLGSYTWSHSIDDSSDLQTLLKPQDNNNFRAERSDSLFDQRHRFVFSGVATSPASWRGSESAFRRFLADFTVGADSGDFIRPSLQHHHRLGRQRRFAKLERPAYCRCRWDAHLDTLSLHRQFAPQRRHHARLRIFGHARRTRHPLRRAFAARRDCRRLQPLQPFQRSRCQSFLRRGERAKRAQRRTLLQPPDRRLRRASIPVRLEAQLLNAEPQNRRGSGWRVNPSSRFRVTFEANCPPRSRIGYMADLNLRPRIVILSPCQISFSPEYWRHR
jgi:hypothetical protein